MNDTESPQQWVGSHCGDTGDDRVGRQGGGSSVLDPPPVVPEVGGCNRVTRDRRRRRRRRPRHVIVRRGARPERERVPLSCPPMRSRRRSRGALRQRDRPTGEPCDGVGAAGDRQADKVTTPRNRRRSDARTIEGKYGNGILATKSVLNTDHPTRAITEPSARSCSSCNLDRTRRLGSCSVVAGIAGRRARPRALRRRPDFRRRS